MKTLLSILCITILFSCSKTNDDASFSPSTTTTPEGLIKSYSIDNEWENVYIYNTDSTLNKIVTTKDGAEYCTETFSYQNSKIIESVKQCVDGANTTTQFEYNSDLIIKLTENINGVLFRISNFNYNSNDQLETITSDITDNGAQFTRVTMIEKLSNEDKIRVTREGVATHIISYDQKQKPQSAIPSYKPIIKINYNGLLNNIFLTEAIVADSVVSTIESAYTFDSDSILINSTTILKRHQETLDTQEFEYEYH